MSPPDELKTYCLVVGGGALGLLLANSLRKTEQFVQGRMKLGVASRSSLPQPVTVRSTSTGQTETLDVPVDMGTPEECIDRLQMELPSRLVLFLCVAPENTEAVFEQWHDAIGQLQSRRKVEFVFCNNGLLSSNILNKISIDCADFSYLRAIFLVGAERRKAETGCEVDWNGGDLVYWGSLSEVSANNCARQSSWLSEVAGHTQCSGTSVKESFIGFLKWREDPQIMQTERAKFFTNFMLAAIIGPTIEKNGRILEITSENFRKIQADQFGLLWSRHGVTSRFILENLDATVSATSGNHNSLSLQGVRGGKNTMNYFIQTLENEIKESRLDGQLQELCGFIQATKKSWGLMHDK